MPPKWVKEKQPNEIIPVSVDFTDYEFPAGESLVGANSTFIVKDDAGADVTATMRATSVATSGRVITAWVQAGTSGRKYLITVTGATQTGKFEEDIELRVREINLTS